MAKRSKAAEEKEHGTALGEIVLPRAFHRDVATTLKSLGDGQEWEQEADFVPKVEDLLRKHGVTFTVLLKRVARQVASRALRQDESARQGLFPGYEQVLLGDGKRIKRKHMNVDRLHRRKRVIDGNQINQQLAWQAETKWLNEKLDLLASLPPATTINEVEPDDTPEPDIAPVLDGIEV